MLQRALLGHLLLHGGKVPVLTSLLLMPDVALGLELEQLGRQAQLQTQRLQLARQELVRGQDLATRGILARAEIDKRQAAALGAEQDLAALRRQISIIERDISDIEARIAAIPIEKETIQAESKSAIANLEQRSIDAGTRWTQTVILDCHASRRRRREWRKVCL